ncbi:CDKN2A-interacting protein-like [Emydura macquarii macquarii]|uniref:CDKN2A-interacting protein-like n=1 Tax=Emydura macquarii macquarii TaxID=1129001 RepID=UPI00352A566F
MPGAGTETKAANYETTTKHNPTATSSSGTESKVNSNPSVETKHENILPPEKKAKSGPLASAPAVAAKSGPLASAPAAAAKSGPLASAPAAAAKSGPLASAPAAAKSGPLASARRRLPKRPPGQRPGGGCQKRPPGQRPGGGCQKRPRWPAPRRRLPKAARWPAPRRRLPKAAAGQRPRPAKSGPLASAPAAAAKSGPLASAPAAAAKSGPLASAPAAAAKSGPLASAPAAAAKSGPLASVSPVKVLCKPLTSEDAKERQPFFNRLYKAVAWKLVAVGGFSPNVNHVELLNSSIQSVKATLDVAFVPLKELADLPQNKSSHESIVCELRCKSVYLGTGCGKSQENAKAIASREALKLFLKKKVIVKICKRKYKGREIEDLVLLDEESKPSNLPPALRNPQEIL